MHKQGGSGILRTGRNVDEESESVQARSPDAEDIIAGRTAIVVDM